MTYKAFFGNRTAVAVAAPSFGWFEPFGRPAPSICTKPLDAFVRPIGDGTTTPTPSILGWFEPYGRPAPGKVQIGTPAWDPQPYTLTTEIGWFEPYGRPPKAARAPDSAKAEAPQRFTDPSIGWLEPYVTPPKITKAPIDATVEALQPFVPPLFGWFETFIIPPPGARRPRDAFAFLRDQTVATVTPSIFGWLVQFGKPAPATKAPLIDHYAFGQPIAAVTTLTTDIGWFEPFGRPQARAHAPRSQWSSHFGARPDLGIAWFEPYARAASVRARTPLAAAVLPPQTQVVTVTFGWFEPWPQPRSRATAPFDAATFIASYSDVTPEPVIVVPPGGTSRRDIGLARRMRARALRLQELEDAIAAGAQAEEHLRALAIRYKSEGVDFEEMMNDWLLAHDRAAFEVNEEEAIDILLLSM